jgi:3-hydroxyisobutyrate dehydrogenase
MGETKAVKVGVIGLGSMGLGIAGSVLKKGLAVVGFDANPAVTRRFAELGGEAGANAVAAGEGADILIVVVVNAAQTETVLFGENGAGARMAKGGVVISCATMAPDDARRFAAKAESQGLLYLDAPISGGAAKAAAGELTVMASGTAEAFARARPALDAMATKVHELGNRAGVGASFKMVNQLLAGAHIAAACEAMTFAAKLGLDLRAVYEVITGAAGNSWMFENRVPHILEGDYSPRSAVEIFTKDLGIVEDIGRREKFPTPIAAASLQLFLMTAAAGMEKDDDASIARMIAKMTGVDLPKPKQPR